MARHVTGMKILVLLQGRKRFFTATCKGESVSQYIQTKCCFKGFDFWSKGSVSCN